MCGRHRTHGTTVHHNTGHCTNGPTGSSAMTDTDATITAVPPHEDHGFFGPGSVTWKVLSYPTAWTVGFQRTVAVEVLEPFLLASVADTGAVRNRPDVRYERTLQYVATVAFGDSASAVKAADVLMRIHRHIQGIEPISGQRYDANRPDAQLWIHLTQWHSTLLAYEVFGPGPLTPDEERQYWAECRRAAELQTIDLDDVPRDRAAMRAYYERMRPRLAVTARTHDVLWTLLDPPIPSDLPLAQRVARRVVRPVMRRATIATLPRWLREMAGIRQSRIADAAIVALLRPVFRRASKDPAAMLEVLAVVSPGAQRVVAPAFLGVAPVRGVTVTPAEAWHRLGRPNPRAQYAEQVAARTDRLVDKAPRDPGAEHLLEFA